MNKYISALIILILMLTAPVNAEVKLGIYYCYTEKMVGIQPKNVPANIEKDEEKKYDWMEKNRTAGSLKPSKGKFIIKIKKHDWKNEFPKLTSSELKKFKEGYCRKPSSYIDEVIKCSNPPIYELEIPSEKIARGGKLYSFQSPNRFRGTNTYFMMSRNLSYVLTNLQWVFGNYLEEGQCETFQE